MKAVVILPTYNEAGNIDIIVPKLLEQEVDILFIDDASQDGTANRIKNWIEKTSRVNLIERTGKLGLGTAYVAGFKWALNRDYQYILEMDADLSHDPSEIPNFIRKCQEGYDLVIGSRYTRGRISVVGWDFHRLLLSKFANKYATTILRLKFLSDITSGYRCYNRTVIESIELENIQSNGYAFQIEMAYKTYKKGFKITEIPIIFYERSSGSSKMSRKIALEAAIMVWKLRLGL